MQTSGIQTLEMVFFVLLLFVVVFATLRAS